MGNIRNYRDINLITTEASRNYLVLEPNYRTKNLFRTFISHKNENNTDTYEQTKTFSSVNTDYVTLKYWEKDKSFYMQTG